MITNMQATINVQDINKRLAEQEYNDSKTCLTAKPRILFVELTRRCNLACVMCREPGEVDRKQTMSKELFQTIEEELFPFAEIIDLRGWGESLILPDFAEKAHAAYRHGASIRIVTNLSFKRPELLNMLADMHAYIGISLDGATQETMHRLRRNSSLPHITKNMQILSKLYEERNIIDRITMYTTCQRPNLDELPDLVRLVASCGIRRMALAPVTIADEHPISLANVNMQQVYEKVKKVADEAGVRVFLTASLDKHMDSERLHGKPCIHPWYYCHITYDGHVGFCDHLIGPAMEDYALGNLNKSSFNSIWNSKVWQNLRQEHLNTRRAEAPYFKECAWCYKHRMIDFEELFTPSLAVEKVWL